MYIPCLVFCGCTLCSCARVYVRDCTHKSNVQCLYKFPPCASGPLLAEGISAEEPRRSLNPGSGGGDGSLWDLEGDCGLEGRRGICVMSSPRKAEVFLHLGQSARPRLSAALDGLSGDIGRLCGCILLKPGVCSCGQEQACTPSTETCKGIHKCIHTHTHTQWSEGGYLCGVFRDCSYLPSWGLIILSLCTVSSSKYH